MEGFGNAMDKGLESIGDLSERITKVVEDAIARAFDEKKQNREDDGVQG